MLHVRCLVPRLLAAGTVALALAAVPAARGDVVTVGASKDNTLFESATGGLSNGAGDRIYAGLTGSFAGVNIRRGLLAFDVASAVPSGSTITSVELTLHLTNSAPGSGDQILSLHTVLQDWGEGASVSPGGSGGAAAPGDATWIHTFSDSSFWTTAGGDFDAIASASTTVGSSLGAGYTWSSASLVSDVQAWLDDPAQNYGWVLRGNEAVERTAKAFGSRENADSAFRPELRIEFVTAPAPSALALLAVALARPGRRRR
ncbi:MAG: DNRLRE domain-containing protein [Planctomycetota bacterium]|jgi:hypothetical protein